MNKRTLIIGGTGFIGSNLCLYLVQSGRTVTVLSRTKLNPLVNLKGANFVVGCFSDKEIITNLVANSDEVVHLAYASTPNMSFNDPIKDLSDNLPPNLFLMQQCAEKNVRLIYVSSGGTVYGQAQFLPIDEAHPTNPISPYGVTKLTLEHYAFLYAKTKGLSYICIRPANPYGIGQKPFLGQGFIPTAIASAMQGQPIPIYGDRGTIRDYIYIDDLSQGIVAAMNLGSDGDIFNIGSGVGRSNLDVLQALSPLLCNYGVDVKVQMMSKRAFDVQENVLDSSKLSMVSGWHPKEKFSDGLEKAIKFVHRLD
jgi:UDP-glucose 4-epimerase